MIESFHACENVSDKLAFNPVSAVFKTLTPASNNEMILYTENRLVCLQMMRSDIMMVECAEIEASDDGHQRTKLGKIHKNRLFAALNLFIITAILLTMIYSQPVN